MIATRDSQHNFNLLEVRIGFSSMIHALFGLYVYEWFLSLDFEWEFVTGKRQFRWPMIFYFANRYCLLAAMIGLIIAMDIKTKINCTALSIFVQLTAAASVGLASINLSIRTIAIWSSNKYIVGGLILAIIGQWSLVFQVEHLKADWTANDLHCVSRSTNKKILSAFFIYAMCLDLIVLLLTSYKLFVLNPSKISGKSRLEQMIYVDGISFFVVAFLGNMVATISITLNMNPSLDVMFSGPAAVLCTIAACRAVRRLKNSVQNINADYIAPKPPICAVHIKTEVIYHRDEYQLGDIEKSLSDSSSSAISGKVKGGDQEFVS